MHHERCLYAAVPQSMPGLDEIRIGRGTGVSTWSPSIPQMQSAFYLPSPSGGGEEDDLEEGDDPFLQSGVAGPIYRDAGATQIGSQVVSNSSHDVCAAAAQAQTHSHGRVLLLRNLASAVTEAEVEGLLAPFARHATPKIYLQFGSGHAFVELSTNAEAEEAHDFFKTHPTCLKGSAIQVHFSEREHVTVPEDVETRVLLATVSNLAYPVDIELLHFLFSRFGTVMKIVSFIRSQGTFQALVQMQSASQAREALTALHSRNIYDGCNTLQIQPSRLLELNVRQNNSKAWDYTIAPEGALRSPLGDDIRLANNIPDYAEDWNAPNGPGPFDMSNPKNLDYACNNGTVPVSDISRKCRSPGFLKIFSLSRLPKEVRDWKNSIMQSNICASCVLIVYNLSAEAQTVAHLFNIFSVYGIVQRIKILREKPDTALIQYSDPVFGSMAQYFLQGIPLFSQDSTIQIGFSKNAEVKLSLNGDNGASSSDNRTRAFQSQEQRHSPQEIEKFVRSVCCPTRTLFVANLKEDFPESQVLDLFEVYGEIRSTQVKVPSDGTGRKFLLVEFASSQEAIRVLAMTHNTRFGEVTIKVAFSKLQLSRPPSSQSSSSVPIQQQQQQHDALRKPSTFAGKAVESNTTTTSSCTTIRGGLSSN